MYPQAPFYYELKSYLLLLQVSERQGRVETKMEDYKMHLDSHVVG